MARRFETIEDIAWRGLRLRLWCFACGRGAELDAGEMLQTFVAKGWPVDLPSARERFPCRNCRSSAEVLILPASAPPPAPLPEPAPELTWEQETVAFFHAMRAQRKKRDNPHHERLFEMLRERTKRPPPR